MNQKIMLLVVVSISWLATIAHSQQVEVTTTSAGRAELPDLPDAARWESEPITININDSYEDDQYHSLPTGAFLVRRTDQGEVVVTIIQAKGLSNRGWARNLYLPVLLTVDGKVVDICRPRWWKNMGHLWTHHYRSKHEELATCDSFQVGIGIIDLASRMEQSRLATSQMKNAQVLPIPIVGKPLDFTLKGVDGKSIRDEDFRGKYLLIGCWATWCTPCMEKMPELKKLNEKHSASLAVVGINFDDELEVCEAAMKKLDLPWPEIHAATSALPHKEAWTKISQISMLPRLLLVNPEGVLIAELRPDYLEDQLKEQMKKDGAGAPGSVD